MMKTESLSQNIHCYLTVSRWEFLPSIIPFTGIPIFFSFLHGSSLDGKLIPLALASFVFCLSYFIGSKINCVSDYAVDSNYKTHLHDAVDLLGYRTIWISIFVEIFLAVLMVLKLASLIGNWLILFVWLAGLALAFIYSVEPVRTKGRGVLNILTLNAVLTTLPPVFIYLVVRERLDLEYLLFLGAFNIQIASTIIFNEIEDYPEDWECNIMNPCVLWGMHNASLAALLLLLTGVVALLLLTLYFVNFHWLLPLLIVQVSYYPVLNGYYRMFKLCSEVDQELLPSQINMTAIRALGAKLPAWLVWLGVPVAGDLAIIYANGGLK